MEFNKLDQYLKKALMEVFIIQKIYLTKLNSHINEHLANFIMDKQFLIWDKNNLHKYKKIYLTSKAQLFLNPTVFYPNSLQYLLK